MVFHWDIPILINLKLQVLNLGVNKTLFSNSLNILNPNLKKGRENCIKHKKNNV